MPDARFVGSVSFINELMFPRSLYPAITVPPGVPAYDAVPKTLAEIATIAAERNRRYAYTPAISSGLGIPAGYTRSDLSVRFENLDQQWQTDARGNWVFQGGCIRLELTVGVYADQRATARPRCWSLILEHELLHVRDEIDIVMNHLPSTLNQSTMVRGFLQQPTSNATYNSDIKGTGDGSGSLFEQRIQRMIWIQESSRRAALVHQQRPGDTRSISDCLGGL